MANLVSKGQYGQTRRNLATKVQIGDYTSIERLLYSILSYRVVTDTTFGGGGGGEHTCTCSISISTRLLLLVYINYELTM